MATMSPLRQRMSEDMMVRNLSLSTQQSYIYAIAKFSQHFGYAPDRLSFEQVRAYQLHLITRPTSGPPHPPAPRSSAHRSARHKDASSFNPASNRSCARLAARLVMRDLNLLGFRADFAHHSDLMSPGAPGVLTGSFLASAKPHGQS
ncbi:phage integrase N-terminal SAM-like domain-containing protein [Bradyrhizobium australiense]|uniref:Core-binding (CB) domain-containing protein n=1 Tax=Bradyrhizobium australiense TaxID=2721161 RepID=A0A7Y4GZ35_9BRAD|nr:phage integrase N-terminal SAM-like domain-containing protein [Bradyrhizobium australiense]NOJ44645.1 hypothetical protein [Bradyrhizobium australiense]